MEASVFRHTGWHRSRVRVYDALLDAQVGCDRISRFLDCGKHALVLRDPVDPDNYRIAGSQCHDRFCLPCGNNRSNIIARNLLQLAEGKQLRFLTLTLRGVNRTLADLISELNSSFRALRRRSHWKKHVVAGAAFLELKWEEYTNRWHVHLHCLLEGRYYPQKLIRRAWREITKDSYIVDIRPAGGDSKVYRYVSKYASKPLDKTVLHEHDRLVEAIVALKGTRMCTTFGKWRGASLTDVPDAESWELVDTLQNLIDQALDGDGAAQAIIEALGVPDVVRLTLPEARPPPPPTYRIETLATSHPPLPGLLSGGYCDPDGRLVR